MVSQGTTTAPPPAQASGVVERGRPGAGERIRDGLERSWRPVALLLACFAAWWAVSAFKLVEEYLVPSPGATLRLMVDKWGYIWHHTWVTTYETLIGFALAVLIGVLAAVLMVYSATVERTLYPILLFAQVIPKIAIAPLFVVWLGFGIGPKIVVAVLIAFFPVVISMVAGLKAVDPEMLELSATMGASPLAAFAKIRLPASLPHLFSGLKVAVTLAVTGAVVGEFVGATKGLGYVIIASGQNANTSLAFAAIVLLSLMSIVLFYALVLAERLLVPWAEHERT